MLNAECIDEECDLCKNKLYEKYKCILCYDRICSDCNKLCIRCANIMCLNCYKFSYEGKCEYCIQKENMELEEKFHEEKLREEKLREEKLREEKFHEENEQTKIIEPIKSVKRVKVTKSVKPVKSVKPIKQSKLLEHLLNTIDKKLK